MVNADHLRDAQPWLPTLDPVELAMGLKTIEEMGEGVSAVARCLMQGINESEPVTKKPNKEWLEDELADIQAAATFLINRYKLDGERMLERRLRKYAHLNQWHDKLRAAMVAGLPPP